MKLVSILSTFLLAAGAFAAEVEDRELLTTLEEHWYVGDPTVSYDSGTNTFTFTISTGDGNLLKRFVVDAFDNCPNGDNRFGPNNNGASWTFDTSYDWEFMVGPFTFTLTGAIIDNIVEFDPPTVGPAAVDPDAEFDWTIPFQISENIANYPSMYSVTGTTGTATVCFRAGLYNSAPYGFSIVNFRQFMLTVNYDLESDFAVTSFETQVIEEETGTFDDEFETEASLCDGATPSTIFNQGQEVCVTICPVAADIDLASTSSVTDLTLELTNPGSGPSPLIQSVILGGNVVGGAVATPVCNVDRCCQVRFIPNGIFFPYEFPDTGIVEVDGTVVMEVGDSRRVLTSSINKRALQETADAKFETEFAINQQQQSRESSATTKIAALAAGAAGVGAAMLI